MNKSESLTNIAKALVAVEKEIKNPKATKENPFFHSHYPPLDAILEENRPLLAKNGLTVIQSPGGNGEGTTVTTMLLHISGEFIESDPLPLTPDKDTPQGAGSAVTYGRRYSLMGMLGIASDEDDDATAGEPKAPAKSTMTTNTPRVPDPKPVSEKQLGFIHSLAADLGFTEEDKEDLKREYGVTSTKDLTSAQAHKIIDDLKAKVEKLVTAEKVAEEFEGSEII